MSNVTADLFRCHQGMMGKTRILNGPYVTEPCESSEKLSDSANNMSKKCNSTQQSAASCAADSNKTNPDQNESVLNKSANTKKKKLKLKGLLSFPSFRKKKIPRFHADVPGDVSVLDNSSIEQPSSVARASAQSSNSSLDNQIGEQRAGSLDSGIDCINSNTAASPCSDRSSVPSSLTSPVLNSKPNNTNGKGRHPKCLPALSHNHLVSAQKEHSLATKSSSSSRSRDLRGHTEGHRKGRAPIASPEDDSLLDLNTSTCELGTSFSCENDEYGSSMPKVLGRRRQRAQAQPCENSGFYTDDCSCSSSCSSCDDDSYSDSASESTASDWDGYSRTPRTSSDSSDSEHSQCSAYYVPKHEYLENSKSLQRIPIIPTVSRKKSHSRHHSRCSSYNNINHNSHHSFTDSESHSHSHISHKSRWDSSPVINGKHSSHSKRRAPRLSVSFDGSSRKSSHKVSFEKCTYTRVEPRSRERYNLNMSLPLSKNSRDHFNRSLPLKHSSQNNQLNNSFACDTRRAQKHGSVSFCEADAYSVSLGSKNLRFPGRQRLPRGKTKHSVSFSNSEMDASFRVNSDFSSHSTTSRQQHFLDFKHSSGRKQEHAQHLNDSVAFNESFSLAGLEPSQDHYSLIESPRFSPEGSPLRCNARSTEHRSKKEKKHGSRDRQMRLAQVAGRSQLEKNCKNPETSPDVNASRIDQLDSGNTVCDFSESVDFDTSKSMIDVQRAMKKTAFWIENNGYDHTQGSPNSMPKDGVNETDLCNQIIDIYFGEDYVESDSSLSVSCLENSQDSNSSLSFLVDENCNPEGEGLCPVEGDLGMVATAVYVPPPFLASQAKTRKIRPDEMDFSTRTKKFYRDSGKPPPVPPRNRPSPIGQSSKHTSKPKVDNILKEKKQNVDQRESSQRRRLRKNCSTDSDNEDNKDNLLSEHEVDTLTKLHTICNSQRVVKCLNRSNSTMIIKDFPPPKHASRLSWSEKMVDASYNHHTPKKSPVNTRSILITRPNTFTHPYEDDTPSPIVITRVRRSKSLSRKKEWPW